MYKELIKDEKGFTFLEIIVIIAIMGFLASMTVPAIGHVSKIQRVKATEKKLEEIKTAIIGKQDVFDENGLPLVNGYVGDMGQLPKLYYSEIKVDDETEKGKWKWTKETHEWKWEQKEIDNGTEKETKNFIVIDEVVSKTKKLELIDVDNNGKGQPRGLWMKEWGTERKDIIDTIEQDIDVPDMSGWKDEDFNEALERIWYYENLGEKWKGPYISHPKAMYPDAAKNLDPVEDKEIYEQKETEGKAIDAWGRPLYFFKEYEKYEEKKDDKGNDIEVGIESTATFIMVSQGPDEEIKLPDVENDENYSSVADDEKNKDNIVVKITPNEWYEAYNKGKENETKKQLEHIRDALIGSFNATDKDGKKIIGGYIGDIGEWPSLYRYDENTKKWELGKQNKGQPIGIWKDLLKERIFEKEEKKQKDELEEKKDGVNNSVIEEEIESLEQEYIKLKLIWKKSWKGPYVLAPWDDVIKDSWGNKLQFEIKNEEKMIIKSAGIDGKFDTEENPSKDDLSIVIDLSEWKNQEKEIALNDEKKVKETKELLEDIRAALLGPQNARDVTGRGIVGGYLSDMGKLPDLYSYDEKKGSWSDNPVAPDENGQPIDLWIKEDVGALNDGFGWRGRYFSNPHNRPIKDAWGNPLIFKKVGEDGLTITSAGVDGYLSGEKGESDDNIEVKIEKTDWKASNVKIKGVIYNNKKPGVESFNPNDNSTSEIKGDTSEIKGESVNVTLELLSKNIGTGSTDSIIVPRVQIKKTPIKTKVGEEEKILGYDSIISGGGKKVFVLEATDVVLGLRKFKVTGDGLNEEIDVFIGKGGTVSPSGDKLSFTIQE